MGQFLDNSRKRWHRWWTTKPWTHALSRFHSYDKLIYSSYIPFQSLLHMMYTWKHYWKATISTYQSKTCTTRDSSASEFCWDDWTRRHNFNVRVRIGKLEYNGEETNVVRSKQSISAEHRGMPWVLEDNELIRSPDELQFNHNPQNGRQLYACVSCMPSRDDPKPL